MAIHPSIHPQGHPTGPLSAQSESSSGQSAEALHNISPLSLNAVHGTSVPLAIPLDDHTTSQKPAASDENSGLAASNGRSRREPIRRDSLKRREALLKGNEGSRRRQRWENDRLLSNPWVQPPLPSDWEVHPTYPRHAVPYYLAPLWDTHMSSQSTAENKKQDRRTDNLQQTDAKVPKDLREKLKKRKAAKGLLQDLEEQVRKFVGEWEERRKAKGQEQPPEMDSEDEEIVFVGRNGQMHDMPPSPRANKNDLYGEDGERNKLVFYSSPDDHGASFGRWLVHSIAAYYDLTTWSVTTGNPARREAYVGIKQTDFCGRTALAAGKLPRPLWGLV
ncbi:MAG: hypothetical protein Q9190_004442 [Brigantiaea leucoxantha]